MSSTSASFEGMPPPKRRRDTVDLGDDNRPLAITCTPCRSRKIKCDSKKPTCDNCSKNPQECIYPLKLKPGLRAGAGTDMAKRLEQLEDRVRQYEARLLDQEDRLNRMSQWQEQYERRTSVTSPQFTPYPVPVLATATSQPSSLPSSFPPIIGSGGELSVSSFSTSVPGASSVPAPLDIPSFNTTLSPGPGSVASTSFVDTHILPPDDVVQDLITLYFTNIAPWAPIIPHQRFAPPWNIVVHAIVVVTIRFSTDPTIASAKQQYRQVAKSHVLSHAIESTSIASVQALALLALDLIGSEQGPSSWGILALLTRSAVHLGLIAEDENAGRSGSSAGSGPSTANLRTRIIPPPANWGEDESRRRLFWLIFCLDRYACASTGWDFALPDFEIKRRLPCSDQLWYGDEWFTAPLFNPPIHGDRVQDTSVLSPMTYLVEVLDLLGRAHTLQTHVVESNNARELGQRKDMTMTLTFAAKRWFADLPLADIGQPSMALAIQAIYHATLLKLNAYYAYPALSKGSPEEPYGSTCMSSAHSLATLCRAAREIGFDKSSSPLFIWGIWVAARVLFVNAFMTHKERDLDEDFETILAALKDQAQYWSVANEYTKLLEKAKRKWARATNFNENTAGSSSLPGAIHALLDLRRTAYSAVGTVGTSVQATPAGSPPEIDLSHLPAWAVQPVLGDLHEWFDLPPGLFADV